MATTSGRSRLVAATTRRTSSSPMVRPTCRSVIWAMERPESFRGRRASLTGTSWICGSPSALVTAKAVAPPAASTAPPATARATSLRRSGSAGASGAWRSQSAIEPRPEAASRARSTRTSDGEQQEGDAHPEHGPEDEAVGQGAGPGPHHQEGHRHGDRRRHESHREQAPPGLADVRVPDEPRPDVVVHAAHDGEGDAEEDREGEQGARHGGRANREDPPPPAARPGGGGERPGRAASVVPVAAIPVVPPVPAAVPSRHGEPRRCGRGARRARPARRGRRRTRRRSGPRARGSSPSGPGRRRGWRRASRNHGE